MPALTLTGAKPTIRVILSKQRYCWDRLATQTTTKMPIACCAIICWHRKLWTHRGCRKPAGTRMMTRPATETWLGERAAASASGVPQDLISYPEEAYQVHADLVGGALQSICEAWEAV